MPITIQPVERAGQFWVNISLDGCALEPRGPFHDASEAAAMADRLAAICRGMFHSCQPSWARRP
jgi:hypothetical protein